MKIKLLLIFLLSILFSCIDSENSKQIFTYKDESYGIWISTIEMKVNAKGETQCSKYSFTNKNDTVFTSYGLHLKKLIANSYGSNSKYFEELPFDSLNEKYFDIRIENYTNKILNYDSILLMNICKVFNIKIYKVDSLLKGYKLEIQDILKLNSKKTFCQNCNIKYEDGVWEASCINLHGLAKILDEYSNTFIGIDSLNKDCYSIDFLTGNNINKISAKLNEYGLTLKEKEINKSFYKIITVANNRYTQ